MQSSFKLGGDLADLFPDHITEGINYLHNHVTLSEGEGQGSKDENKCDQFEENWVFLRGRNIVIEEIEYYYKEVPGYLLWHGFFLSPDNCVELLVLTVFDAFFDCYKFIGLEETFTFILEIFLVYEGGSSDQLEFYVVEGIQ